MSATRGPIDETGVAKELDHVLRPKLPWRRRDLTECGLDPNRCVTITADELLAKIRKIGQQRAAFSTCMTCMNKVSFDLRTGAVATPKLVDIVRREVRNYNTSNDEVFEIELRVLAALADRHQDEFNALVDALADTADLADHRNRFRGRTRRA